MPTPGIKICSRAEIYLFLVRVEMSSGERTNRLVPGDHYLLKHLIPYTSCKATSMAEAAGKTLSSPIKIILTHFQPSSSHTEVIDLILRNVRTLSGN